MFRILLIEDNLNYRIILKQVLLRSFIGLEIKECTSETDTLRVMKNFTPDLIILDLSLEKNANGLSLVEQIKSDCKDAVILVLGANDIQEYRTAAQSSGADFFLSISEPLKNILDYTASAIKHKQALTARYDRES